MFTPSEGEEELTLTGDGYEVTLADPISQETAYGTTQRMLNLLIDLVDRSSGRVEIASDTATIRRCLASDVFFAIPHIEGAEAIDRDLANLESLYDQGIRSLGLVWSRPNAFGHGVPYAFPRTPDTGPGLTDAGKELVRACNRLGIMIDLSHVNLRGFNDVARMSDAVVRGNWCEHSSE
jgi:membrane dipeptidase